MTKTHGGWIWYELMTPDPAGAKAFYEAVVPGWTLQTGVRPEDGYGFIANADGGMTGGILPLTDAMAAAGCVPIWVGYIGVDDCDAAVAAIEAAGGRCTMPAQDVPMAGRIAMVADPNGAPFYVMTPTPPPGGVQSTSFSTTLQGRCGWNELRAADQAKALDFYTQLFGWGLPEPMDMGPMGKYQFINQEDVGIGAIMPNPGGAAIWRHYFRVPSATAAADALKAAGGAVASGPMQVPNGDWVVMGSDPQGALFALTGGE